MLNIKHRTEIISAIAALCIAIFVAMASVFMANTISARFTSCCSVFFIERLLRNVT